MDLKLPFGLKNGQLIHVSDVESGLKCECSCPACGDSLIARKGKVKIHHFAHHNLECVHGFETAIHLAAKQAIEQAGYIQLPRLEYMIIGGRKSSFKETTVHFDKIYLEKRYDDIIPDILLEKNGRTLCVEVYVTHKVDEKKKKKIIERNLSAIEIDLSNINRSIDFELLKKMVVDSVENKKWLFNSKRLDLHKKILKNSIWRKTIPHGLFGRHVDDCPIPARFWNGKPCADVIRDCFECKYFVNPESNYKDDDIYHHNHEEGIIYCIGHKTEEEINNLLNSSLQPEKAAVQPNLNFVFRPIGRRHFRF